MARYIDEDVLMQKLSRMIDYCREDNKVNGLTALFQVGDAIMDCPTADVVPKSEVARLQEDVDRLQEINNRQVENIKLAKAEVAREIFAEIERILEAEIICIEGMLFHNTASNYDVAQKRAFEGVLNELAELKKKYTEVSADEV